MNGKRPPPVAVKGRGEVALPLGTVELVNLYRSRVHPRLRRQCDRLARSIPRADSSPREVDRGGYGRDCDVSDPNWELELHWPVPEDFTGYTRVLALAQLQAFVMR